MVLASRKFALKEVGVKKRERRFKIMRNGRGFFSRNSLN